MTALHFDCNATTAASADVIDSMLPWLGRPGANPSATHPAGREAARAVHAARSQVAALVGAADPSSIVFTSSGSESTATAFQSAAASRSGSAFAVSTAEHSATRKCAERAAGGQEAVDWIAVESTGEVSLASALDAVVRRPALVSLILVNNETGVISELEPIGAAAREAGVLFHVDAVQAPGKVEIDVERLGCDYLSLSAHKFHGPRGIGALYVRPGAPLTPMVLGGPQEKERRAGTENVPAIIGMGVAAEVAAGRATSSEAQAEIRGRRDALEAALLEGCPGSVVHGGGAPRRAANATSIGFDLEGTGLDATALLGMLHDDGMEVSAGSACNSTQMAPSPVLRAMGCDDLTASSALRFSLAHAGTPDATTHDDVLECVKKVIAAYSALSALRAG